MSNRSPGLAVREVFEMKPADITMLIEQAAAGREDSLNQLMPLIYPDLKQIAAALRRKQFNAGETMNTTSLVNEAWLKLNRYGVHATNRKHFFCIAAQAMRQILMDAARAKNSLKRKGQHESLDDHQLSDQTTADWLLQLDAVIDAIADYNPRTQEVFQLKYFLGMKNTEVAALLEVNVRTVKRDWAGVKQVIKQALSSD